MKDRKCTKKLPKELNPHTVAIFNGYPRYRRVDNGIIVNIKSNQIDNRHDYANVVLNKQVSYDEINTFLNCRYVSAPEALWRIFEFSLGGMSHKIIRLQVHLPDNQMIYFVKGEEQAALDRAAQHYTHLSAWFNKSNR
ncbi:uncharacterized protein LOC124811257 [Hydra vulgaris]|uniref:uncharacterized protein LOC124811257 n=1 Tax=Hydra vulgaris TaxID=6087 RepID=UPI001F5F7046|nr:uncharacterized protein LOC124811257 [Hydra vulgaris]